MADKFPPNSPVSLLRAQASSIAKSIIKQLTTKSLPTRQAGFGLIHQLVAVLDGGLDSQTSALVPKIEAALKISDNSLSGAATTLKIEVISFLGLFFRTHPLKAFSDELPQLIPLLVIAVRDKFNKIAAEAFMTITHLVKVLRPVVPVVTPITPSTAAFLKEIYDATMGRLASNDADEEVKGKGIICLGALLTHAGDQLAGDFGTSLVFLRDRLKSEVSRLVAVGVAGEVAGSPVCRGAAFDNWVQESLVEVSALLRKVHRPLKVAAFGCISALLERAGNGLPDGTSLALISDLHPLVNDADINLLPLALHTIATLLLRAPSVIDQVKSSILPRIFELVRSPLLQGPSLDGLLAFFRAFVKAGAAPLPLVQTLAGTAEIAGAVDASGTSSGMQALVTASRCIGVIIEEAPQIGDQVVADYSKAIQVSFHPLSYLLIIYSCFYHRARRLRQRLWFFVFWLWERLDASCKSRC